MLTRFFLWESRPGRVLCLIAAVDLFLMMMLTVADVVGRYGFNSPVKGAYELVELMMGISVFAVLPTLSAKNDHISVGLFDRYFAGRRLRAKLILVNLASLIFLALMCWRVWHEVFRNIEYGDASAYLRIPLAPVTFFLALMATLAVLAAVAHVLEVWKGARDNRRGVEGPL